MLPSSALFTVDSLPLNEVVVQWQNARLFIPRSRVQVHPQRLARGQKMTKIVEQSQVISMSLLQDVLLKACQLNYGLLTLLTKTYFASLLKHSSLFLDAAVHVSIDLNPYVLLIVNALFQWLNYSLHNLTFISKSNFCIPFKTVQLFARGHTSCMCTISHSALSRA